MLRSSGKKQKLILVHRFSGPLGQNCRRRDRRGVASFRGRIGAPQGVEVAEGAGLRVGDGRTPAPPEAWHVGGGGQPREVSVGGRRGVAQDGPQDRSGGRSEPRRRAWADVTILDGERGGGNERLEQTSKPALCRCVLRTENPHWLPIRWKTTLQVISKCKPRFGQPNVCVPSSASVVLLSDVMLARVWMRGRASRVPPSLSRDETTTAGADPSTHDLQAKSP